MGPTCGKHNCALRIKEAPERPGMTIQYCPYCEEEQRRLFAEMFSQVPKVSLYDLLDQAQATQRELEKQLEEKSKLCNAYLSELNDYAKTVNNLNAKIEKLKARA